MENIKNKYLVFVVDEESYAIPLAKVQEVIRYVPITSLHETSTFLKGVINLRGKIIPIIDMRLKFDLAEQPYTDRTIFIIVEIVSSTDVYLVGLVVDNVKDVIEVEENKIEKIPEVGFKFKSKYLYGIIQLGEEMVMILNLDTILSSEEVGELKEKVESV